MPSLSTATLPSTGDSPCCRHRPPTTKIPPFSSLQALAPSPRSAKPPAHLRCFSPRLRWRAACPHPPGHFRNRDLACLARLFKLPSDGRLAIHPRFRQDRSLVARTKHTHRPHPPRDLIPWDTDRSITLKIVQPPIQFGTLGGCEWQGVPRCAELFPDFLEKIQLLIMRQATDHQSHFTPTGPHFGPPRRRLG